MLKLTSRSPGFFGRLQDSFQHRSQWMRHWDERLDRLDDYASALGTHHFDHAMLALFCGTAALFLLVITQ